MNRIFSVRSAFGRLRRRTLDRETGPGLDVLGAFRPLRRWLSPGTTGSGRRLLVLGIETSCDDTGAAVVDDRGNILGEALNSQTAIHVEMGGIIPPVARDLHKKHIALVINSAIERANISPQVLDAVAVTIKPGLALSLSVGLQFTKQFVKEHQKPLIPIHHMEAHALMARMTNSVDFPFLTLLISGGHSLLAVVKGVDDFVVIGKGLDDAPGEAYDKTARRLKLKILPQCSGLSGGQAIELLAKDGNPQAFKLHPVMSQAADCNFSFAGIKAWAQGAIEKAEKENDIEGDGIIPNVADLCATFQYMILHHLAKRIQRALLFCELTDLLPLKDRVLVLSGGVASNAFIRNGLMRMCSHYDCSIVCPPTRLCTDNGVMIAWNGMERLQLGIGIVNNIDQLDVIPKCPLGIDRSAEVRRYAIKLPRIKLLDN